MVPEDVDALLATNVKRLPKVLETVEDPETVRQAFLRDDRVGALRAYVSWGADHGVEISGVQRVVRSFIDVVEDGTLEGVQDLDPDREHDSAALRGEIGGVLYDFVLAPVEEE